MNGPEVEMDRSQVGCFLLFTLSQSFYHSQSPKISSPKSKSSFTNSPFYPTKSNGLLLFFQLLLFRAQSSMDYCVDMVVHVINGQPPIPSSSGRTPTISTSAIPRVISPKVVNRHHFSLITICPQSSGLASPALANRSTVWLCRSK